MITEKNIFEEIRKKNYLEVLRSDLVDKVKNQHDQTPLHLLAYKGVKEVLSHPSVDIVKNNDGYTPLHFLAWTGDQDVLDHPSIDKVKDNYSMTPLHHLVHCGYLNREDLKKHFPWYKKEIRNIEKAVDEIVNTPTSVRFILED